MKFRNIVSMIFGIILLIILALIWFYCITQFAESMCRFVNPILEEGKGMVDSVFQE